MSALASGYGCQSAPPSVSAEASIGDALDLSEPVEFRSEGGPLDEALRSSEALTLAGALQQAVSTDPSIQSALARVRIALADSKQARLWPNPVLTLVLRWPRGGGSPVVEASLAQALIQILTAPRRSSAADNRLRESASDALTVALDVAAEVQERYAEVQALDELVPVLRQRRDLLDKLVGLAQARLAPGEGTRQDVIVLEAQRLELDVEIARAEQDQRDERLQLARAIGEPSSPAEWTLDRWAAPTVIDLPESVWVATGLRYRPEVQSVAWRLAALGDDLALASLLKWEGMSGGLEAERDGDWSVGPGASIPIPIFDMGQARAARVTAEQIEARHDLTKVRRGIVEDVRRAYSTLMRSQENLRRVREQLIPLQRQRQSIAETLFRAGESDVTGLFLAEQDLRTAEATAIELERQASIALVRLHRAIGGSGVVKRITGPPSADPSAAVAPDQATSVSSTSAPAAPQEDK